MTVIPKEDDDMTIIASNVSLRRWLASYPAIALAAIESPTKDAIANSRATQVFVMDGTLVKNKRTPLAHSRSC
jgi:hypothetical protein